MPTTSADTLNNRPLFAYPDTGSTATVALTGHCATWCRNPDDDGSPPTTGRLREAVAVDAHGPQCRGPVELSTDALDCDGTLRFIDVQTSRPYFQGDYDAELAATVRREPMVLLAIGADAATPIDFSATLAGDGTSETYVTAAQARSLAAALIAAADRIERR